MGTSVFRQLLVGTTCHFFIHKDPCFSKVLSSFFKDVIYSFLERGKGKEKERERNINAREKHQSIAFHMHLNQD